ncbi:16S rRNA (adenine(1518)-N(6)/adenine(1519)-N(6))-dimethyltransferase RsmA [Anaerotardibacter muris]|uniref:16S rRNA (adenine(1518)-N(6)/adenine(1519)-N(6))- dimethyltransferase RsmA n=1 Tax=Anaerotardibacter muris TaxID=2941505 RepID=UPI00203F590E|nr:16S rRNA (adenine(1518)-N(6)/adenine(1519)-N(6))-dimethyltransferase RsmA [Anaerotardibacter muris]
MPRLSSLASVADTRAVLDQFGLMTKKALGQHFLINDGIVARICALAELTKEDKVVEIGPGIGTLTEALLKEAGEVVSIERDTDLPAVLAQTLEPWSSSFTLVAADALEVYPADLPFAPNKLVANLPYAVAATLVLDYFERFSSLQSATIMVQAEVAERMSAAPGTKNYGAYTVKLNLFAHAAGKFSVAESNFFPPPRVKSTVIRLDRNEDPLDPVLAQATMTMADAAFENRRKTLSNSMKTYFDRMRPDLDVAEMLPFLFEEASIDPKVRGEKLKLSEYLRLGEAFLHFTDHKN